MVIYDKRKWEVNLVRLLLHQPWFSCLFYLFVLVISSVNELHWLVFWLVSSPALIGSSGFTCTDWPPVPHLDSISSISLSVDLNSRLTSASSWSLRDSYNEIFLCPLNKQWVKYFGLFYFSFERVKVHPLLCFQAPHSTYGLAFLGLWSRWCHKGRSTSVDSDSPSNVVHPQAFFVLLSPKTPACINVPKCVEVI